MKKATTLMICALALTGCYAETPNDRAVEGFSRAAQSFTDTGARLRAENVIKVKDGDTIQIDARWNPYPGLKWSVRVLGIDTPEKGRLAKCEREKELSKRAQALSEKLVRESGDTVSLENVSHDKYGGRLLADVRLSDGRSLADELIRSGLAKRYNGAGPKPNWCF